MTVTDYPDYGTPQAHATSIFSTGVPLYSKSTKLASAGATGLAANTSVVLYNGSVNQIGYELGLQLQSDSASLYPFWTVKLSWSDSVTGFEVAREQYNMAGAAPSSYQRFLGTGPTKGDILKITLTNQDTVKAASYQFVLAENSRVYVTDRFMQPSYDTTPNFINASSDPAGLFLVQTAPNINAGAGATRIIPFYTGLVRLWATSAGAYDVLVSAIDPNISSAPAGNQIFEQQITAAGGGIMSTQFSLPRSQCAVSITNNAGSSEQIGVTICAVETPA